ncbi:hypothetical protein Xen7305DRAFT_00053440 [Xenococcus sp. PCC 7305]|nr:hypothetical protein Xen7305DRAFT_00053440 [Xenococcus sp. PCC 7305]
MFGSGDGGTLSVNAERVELIGGSRVAGSSGLFTPVVPGARGDGGDINIEADSLLVAGGAQVFALSVSTATGGEINIEAQDIELNGTSPNGTPSGVFTNTLATGNSGNLNIETNNLVLRDGGDIGSSVLGTGKTGNIIIKANHIDLSDSSSVDNTSSIFATVANKATGVSGDITIETESLILNNGTQISSSVEGSGKGGNIDIRAHEIDLIGYNSIADESSGLFTTIFPGATGDSGNITITADNLRVSSGAQISVATGGFGFAGDLTLRVSESIELTGNAIAEGGGSSGLFSSAVFGDGNGGNLDLTTDQLIIKDGATVSASNFLSGNANVPPGTGLAGDITINAQTIVLNGVDVDTPSSINASTFAGGGGNIELNSQTITATNGAQVNAETSGKGDGGLIQVNTENFTLNNGAVFSSRTSAAGDAGTISVTGSVLEISNQGTITTSSTGNGQAGNIDLKSAEIQTNQGLIIATSEQSGGGDINITNTEFLLMDNNSLISTSVSDSTGGGGNIVIASDYIVNRDNSDIRANASFGDGGTISINTEVILLSADSNIDASSDFGIDGIVEIDNPDSAQQIGVVQLSAEIPDSTGLMTSLCSVEEKNVMAVTGKGGLAENPSQVLRGQSLWEDLRDFSLVSHPEYPAAITKDSVSSQPTKIIEAEGWIINPKGNVQLVVTNYAPFNQCKK